MMLMKRLTLLGAVLAVALGGATAAPAAEAGGVVYTTAAMPRQPALGDALPAQGTAISNRTLARVFTMLTHDMEWGASRPHLVRYEGPISVGMEGPGLSQYTAFLDQFLVLLRQKTGIEIARRETGQNLHIRFVGESFNGLLPTVSCLVAPGDIEWSRFARNPGRHGGRALARARAVEDMTIFIPETAAPYLVRNCMLEEITQALGTANDLYGLGNSIFNDDAAHIWPTELDYLMLRVLYSPEMHTGMDRATTETTAREVLDRINPAGVSAPAATVPDQVRMAPWRDRIHRVFSRRTRPAQAEKLAEEALEIARSEAPQSAYHCHSLLTLGRVTARLAPGRSIEVFDGADRVCREVHGDRDIRLARIAIERAVALLRLHRFDEALPLTDDALPILAAYGQDERISSLYAVQSIALSRLGRMDRAQDAQDLAQQWGAYALGVESETVARWASR